MREPDSPVKHSKKSHRRIIYSIITLIFLLLISEIFTSPPLLAPKLSLLPEMVGSWEGISRITNLWCNQKDLAYVLNISTNGSVKGRVGNAVLSEGHIENNRSWLGKMLKLRTDFAIKGKLIGEIVSKDTVLRDEVIILVNYNGKEFTGGLVTSGTEGGDKTTQKLWAKDLELRKIHK